MNIQPKTALGESVFNESSGSERLGESAFNESNASEGLYNFLKTVDSEHVPSVMRGKSAELESINQKPRYCNIVIFMIVVSSFSMNCSYIEGEITQMKSLLSEKFDWEEGSPNQIWGYEALQAIVQIGACFGAIGAGSLIGHGRRRTLFVTLFILILYASVTQIMGFYPILVARLIGGFAVGVKTVVVNRMIEEYVPLALYGLASSTNQLINQFGIFIGLFSALILPAGNSAPEVFEQNVTWRYVFGFSFVISAISLIGLLFFVRHDTPKFYITQGDEDSALTSIKEIYNTEGSQIQANKILRFIQKSNNQHTVHLSFMDSMWNDERFRRASIVNVILMTFQTLTGYKAVLSFSTSIFAEAYKKTGTGLTPTAGSYLVGVVNLVGAAVGIYVVKSFGRRPIILVGHILMSVLLIGIALATMYEQKQVQLTLILAFIFVYMTSSGPAIYVYMAETVSDAALGIVVFTQYFWKSYLAFSTESYMEIDPSFVFWLYGGFTILSIPFIYFFIGETKGLSEKEKKEIFMPGATWGRNLRIGEKPFVELGNEHKSSRTRKSELLLHSSIGDEYQ